MYARKASGGRGMVLRPMVLATSALAALTLAFGALAAPGDWPGANMDPGGQRHSSLTRITADNVAGLKEAWVYHMKPEDGSGGTRLVTAETVPLVIDGTMYISTPYGRVVALDAATGVE